MYGWLGQAVFGHTYSKGQGVELFSSSSSCPASLGPFLISPLPGLPWSQLHGFKNRTPPDLQFREASNSHITSLKWQHKQVPLRKS